MQTIGDRVRTLRKAQNVARKDLARDAGMSYSGLSDLESGKAKSTTKLHRLAKLLGVNVVYLETGRGSSAVSGSPETYNHGAAIDADIVLDVARALQEAHAELGLTYDFTANPQLFIDAYQRAATFGNFTHGRGNAWLGSHITNAASQEIPTDERTKSQHDQSISTHATGGAKRKG